MRGLGVSASDEQVYRSMLRYPGTAVGPAAIQRLAALGFVSVAADGAAAAVDPRTALDRLIDKRLGEVDGELTRINAARSALPSLLAERSAAEAIELVERIVGQEAAQWRVWEVGRDASEVLAMHRHPQPRPEGVRDRTLHRLTRGAVFRTIAHSDVLSTPQSESYLLEIHRAGDRHRVTSEDIQPLIILDRAAAFVPIEPGHADAGALLVRHPAMVAFLVDLFEHTWARSVDLEPEPDGPSETERAVLGLLAEQAKDEAAARGLGISVRTFRAHVASVMGRLGAANRFQAGARAKERGWI